MGPDGMRSILSQALTALLVIKEQIGSARAIHLHVFQLPKDRVTLGYVHDYPHVPGECGRTGANQGCQPSSPLASWHILLGSHLSLPQHLLITSDSPCTENHRASSGDVYSPWSSGEYISPESSHLSESITGAQQL